MVISPTAKDNLDFYRQAVSEFMYCKDPKGKRFSYNGKCMVCHKPGHDGMLDGLAVAMSTPHFIYNNRWRQVWFSWGHRG